MLFLVDNDNLPDSPMLPGYSRICFVAQLAFQYWHGTMSTDCAPQGTLRVTREHPWSGH